MHVSDRLQKTSKWRRWSHMRGRVQCSLSHYMSSKRLTFHNAGLCYNLFGFAASFINYKKIAQLVTVSKRCYIPIAWTPSDMKILEILLSTRNIFQYCSFSRPGRCERTRSLVNSEPGSYVKIAIDENWHEIILSRNVTERRKKARMACKPHPS